MKREIDPLPAKRNGGLVRIEVDDLEEWYDRNLYRRISMHNKNFLLKQCC